MADTRLSRRRVPPTEREKRPRSRSRSGSGSERASEGKEREKRPRSGSRSRSGSESGSESEDERERRSPNPYSELPGVFSLRGRIPEADGIKWSAMGETAARGAVTAFRHSYKRIKGAKPPVVESLDIAHTHGDFGTTVHSGGDEMSFEKFNISTKRAEHAARSHDALFDATGDNEAGVRNVMRVIKGTHRTKGLHARTRDAAGAAVEFGAEIGVSELTRGGPTAVLHAMENLYLLKHGRIDRATFLDPDRGFAGAGAGGAGRLRDLDAHRDVAWKRNEAALRKHFEEVASKKEKWAHTSFEDWRRLKAAKWMGNV